MAECAPPAAERVVDRWDEVFDALRADPRRQLVDTLLDATANEWVTLPDAAINPNLHVDRERLCVRLHHQHLPLLAASEFVRWEAEPFRAARGPRFDEVAIVFESLYANADRIPERLVEGCRALEAERLDSAGRYRSR